MKAQTKSFNILFAIVFTFLLCTSHMYSQIGYKYKTWIKDKEYLVENTQNSPWGEFQVMHFFKAKGKLFSRVGYNVYTKTGKIVEIVYYFSPNLISQIRTYCSKSGYFDKDSPENCTIYKSSDGLLQYVLFEFPDELQLKISARSLNFKMSSGFE